MSVIKIFNLRRHYETKYQELQNNLNIEQKLQKAEEFNENLTSQQAFFTKAKSQNEAAVKASFIVAEETAKSSRRVSVGELLKSCMMKVCDVLCPDKRPIFGNVSMSRNTVADGICDMATDLRAHLMERSRHFTAYFQAVDESTDVKDTAQLTIFISGVWSNLCITEEILDFKSMQGITTGKDIFRDMSQCVSKCNRHESALGHTYRTYDR